MTAKIQRSLGSVEPHPVMNFQEAFCFDRMVNGFQLTAIGKRSDTGFFDLWRGTNKTRPAGDLRVPGVGIDRDASPGAELTVKSTSINDTSTGSGANVVLVSYIEAGSLFERFGLALLAGLGSAPVFRARMVNGVPTIYGGPVDDAIRVNRGRVIQAGGDNAPGKGNDGTLSIRIGPPALEVEYSVILPGENATEQTSFFVPRGFFACVSFIIFSSQAGPAGAEFIVRVHPWARLTASRVRALIPETRVAVSDFPEIAFTIDFPMLKRAEPMTDVFYSVNNPGASRAVAASADYAFFENEDDPDLDLDLQSFREPVGR